MKTYKFTFYRGQAGYPLSETIQHESPRAAIRALSQVEAFGRTYDVRDWLLSDTADGGAMLTSPDNSEGTIFTDEVRITMRCIIYARFSPRPDADESQSNEKQIERCRAYAFARGYDVAEVFTDEALTGADDEQAPDPLQALARRPGIVAAIAAVKKGMVLLVRWRSRIARDPYIQQAVERIIGGSGGSVEAADESNEIGLAGELTRGVLATVSKYEVIKIRLLTALAMQKHQGEGRRMTRADRCPFGWKVDPADDTRMVQDPAEQATVKMIMDLYRQGKGLSATCRALDKAGRLRRGKSWDNARGTVQSIIDRQKKAN